MPVCDVYRQDTLYYSIKVSNIQLQSAVLKPRVLNFPLSFLGEIVLNADWKSTKSILM